MIWIIQNFAILCLFFNGGKLVCLFDIFPLIVNELILASADSTVFPVLSLHCLNSKSPNFKFQDFNLLGVNGFHFCVSKFPDFQISLFQTFNLQPRKLINIWILSHISHPPNLFTNSLSFFQSDYQPKVLRWNASRISFWMKTWLSRGKFLPNTISHQFRNFFFLQNYV